MKENNVKLIDFTATKENLEEDIFELYCRLFEKIAKDELVIQEMKGGNVNIVCKVYKKNNKDNAVIFRTFDLKLKSGEKQVNGKNESSKGQQQLGIENLFERSTDLQIMNELYKNDLCEKVFAKYNNGLCYKYTNGVQVNGKIMLTDEFLDNMSLKLAKLHSLKIERPEIKFGTNFDRFKAEFGHIVDTVIDEIDSEIEKIDVLPYKNYPKISKLKEEANKIAEKFDQLGWGEIALCHNDLNISNILWNDQDENLANKVGLIDFELVLNNYVAIELSSLFKSYCGHPLHSFDGNLLPDKDYRLRFIKSYLRERNRLANKVVSDEEFERQTNLLFVRINLGILNNFISMSTILPCLDFRKDILNNRELDMNSKGKKYYLGEIALKSYEFYVQIKDEFLRTVDDYLNNNSH